jgi:glycine cleavage system H protein
VNPEELQFNKTHEWVHVSEVGGEKTATIGLSQFAVEALTDLVFIELPEVGRQVGAGEGFGEVESVKAVSDLYSPVAGRICDVNSELPDNLDMLSSDPYGQGWIAKVKITDDSGLADLMDYEAYQRQCAEEEGS